MLIDFISEVQSRVEVVEGGLKTLHCSLDQEVEMLQTMRTSFTGKDFEVMATGVTALKQWTGKTTANVVYDSKVDPFTDECLFQKVKGKRNVAIVGFTTDGDVFGGFYSVAVTDQARDFFDPNIFAFSFESHGRCKTPQRFVVKKGWQRDRASLIFWKSCVYGFVSFWVFGGGGFRLGNEKSRSFCVHVSGAFEGLEDTTLTGKNWERPNFGEYHHCTRLVAIQLS